LEVGQREAAAVLRFLLDRGLLDGSRRITKRRTVVLLPLKSGAAEDATVLRLGKLRGANLASRTTGTPIARIRELSGLAATKSRLLPARWQRIGDVVVVRLPAELETEAEAVGNAYARVLKARAVVDIRRIAGELREPEGRIIHGKSAETVHQENGILYSLDAARLMFSKGNKAERERMGRSVKPGERVLDMFAGIGYFTLPIAVKARPESVVAIEKNPFSFEFLRKNIVLNKVESRVEAVNADCRDVNMETVAGFASTFDRAILGYIPDSGETREGFAGAWEFLPVAARALRPGGVAHFHCLARRGVRKAPMVEGFRGREMRVVKSYGPETCHVVVDLVRDPP